MADLRRRRDLVAGADLVELRLDGVADVDVDGALHGRRLPVVVTCRPVWQGGRFDGDEATRLALLERAWELGADYVDVEDGAADAFVARVGGRRIVRSYPRLRRPPGRRGRAPAAPGAVRRRSREAGRDGAPPGRRRGTPAPGGAGARPRGAAGDGRGGRDVAPAGRPLRIPLVVRRRGSRAGPAAARRDARPLSRPVDWPGHRHLRRGRPSGRALAVADHAQCRLPGRRP